MNEHLDNAWKEFERTGEICNSAEQLLSLTSELTEQNKLLKDALILADSWLKIDPLYCGSPVSITINKVLEGGLYERIK